MFGEQSSFRWYPLGGLGQVGMNCMVFEFGDSLFPVDAGVLFADANDLGVDVVYPDYKPLLEGGRVKNWLITHGHEDHIGAVNAIFEAAQAVNVSPPTIWAPPFAKKLIELRLNDPQNKKYIEQVDCDSEINLQGVRIRYLETRHSIVDACSLVFEWKDPHSNRPLKVVHTSDFKVDPQAFADGTITQEKYRVFGPDGRADVLFIDSTNAERPGRSASELDLLPGLRKLIKESQGRVFLTLFSSNVFRVASLIQEAKELGRQVCLSGRSLQQSWEVAQQVGVLQKYFPKAKQTFSLLGPDQLSDYPDAEQLILCSGSQGEQRSVLSQMVSGMHPDFKARPSDTIIFSSKTIPGNEKTVSRLLNGLLRQGVTVHFEEGAKLSAGGPVHASGHARREEIASVIEVLNPHHVVPVHGELRQLMACADVAAGVSKAKIHICENGWALQFRPSQESSLWELSEEVLRETSPNILRFQKFSVSSKDAFVKTRKTMAAGGVVSLVVDSIGRINVILEGVGPESYLKKHKVVDAIEDFAHSKIRDFDNEQEFAGEIARFLKRYIGIKPFVIVHFKGL